MASRAIKSKPLRVTSEKNWGSFPQRVQDSFIIVYKLSHGAAVLYIYLWREIKQVMVKCWTNTE